MTTTLSTLPPEMILRIFGYLDLPELSALARTCHALRSFATDRVLHRARIFVTAPSRVDHSLFGGGGTLRPTVPDLVHRNLLRGLGIERHWQRGEYFHSPQSVKQYETSLRLQRTQVRQRLTTHLGARAETRVLVATRVFPDIESSLPRVSRMLLPVMRKLKWCIQRDHLAQKVREHGLQDWLERRGRLVEIERVRLAICPGVRPVRAFWEELALTE